jgi:hypothetical protein
MWAFLFLTCKLLILQQIRDRKRGPVDPFVRTNEYVVGLLYNPGNNRRKSPLFVIADSYNAKPVPFVRAQSLEDVFTLGTAFLMPYGI